MNKKLIKNLVLLFLFAAFVGINVVYADRTTGEILFCDYAGIRKALKAIGIAITIAKIVVPLILVFVTIIDLFNVVMSGKSEDLSKALPTAVKRIIAGLLVFMVPSIVLGTYKALNIDPEGTMQACFTCTLKPGECNVEDGDAQDVKANKITTDD